MAVEPFPRGLKMRFASVFLVTSFVVGSVAGPWNQRSETQCASVCTENEKFSYNVGKTYVYNYEANTVNSLGVEEGNVELRIRAKVEVQPLSKCDFGMKLLDVSLENSKSQRLAGSNEFREALERYPLRFGYQDGRIEDLCSKQDEPIWVLNIKRGILSTFQNTMDNLEEDHSQNEVDITGNCATDYKVSGDAASGIVIHKTKDLSKCSDRTDNYSSIQGNPIFGQSTFGASTPVVESSHKCQHQIRNGIMHRSNCSEKHAFQPFSRQDSGATSKNIQSFTLISEEDNEGEFAGSTEHIPVRKSLLFEHTPKDQGRGASKEAEDALKELCHAASHDIRPEVPRLFTAVVRKLQELDYQQLEKIYDNVNDICDGSVKARKFFLDAISMTGSNAGIIMMRNLILTKNHVSDSDARSWFFMLGFVPKPTRSMIKSLTTLLARPSFSVQYPKAILGISALVHSYCKRDANCGSQPEVIDFVNKLAINIGPNCQNGNYEDKQKVVITLKALGNVGHFDDLVVRAIQRCYQSKDNDVDVRLAAIDAFRRLSCIHRGEDRLGAFFNIEEDSEVRIGSYLAAMSCPTSDLLEQIHRTLDLEEVNQVGSFVWTHLTNMKEKSHYEYKYDVKKILSSKKLQKKFSTDFRKFSRYYEGSAYLDALSTGVHLNGDVVFSPKSYLPRSTNLGLGLELFGNRIELFEIGGRAEGFESLVEALFGPTGYFHDDSIDKLLHSAREQKSYSEAKMKDIARLFNMKNAKSDDPRGSFYTRIFGNDLHYSYFNSLDNVLGTADTISVLETIARLAQNEEIEYTKSLMFMDSSLIIPTSIGLPLNLTVNVTATVNLKVGGKIDLSRLSSKSLDVTVHIEPSAAVEISGSMIIDAAVTRSGLKIATTLHTSTYSDAGISVQNGEVVKVYINTPKNQMEIIDIQSKVFVVNGDQENVHEPLVEDTMEIERCTGDALSTYLGIQLCGQLQYPLLTSTAFSQRAVPSWILAGPYMGRLHLQKTDKTLTSYNFEYRWDTQVIDNNLAIRTGRLSLDTPGSTIDRQLKAEFVHNEVEKSVAVRLVSPIKKTSLYGKIVNEEGVKNLDMNWVVDDVQIVTLKTEVVIEATKGNQRFAPSLLINYYGSPVVALNGYATIHDQGKKYSTEMTVEHMTLYPITISSVLTRGERKGSMRYDVDATIDTGTLKTYAKGFFQSGHSNIATKGTFEYRQRNRQKQSVSFSAKFRRNENSKMKTWSTNADFQSTLTPTYNWASNFDAQRTTGGHAESQLTFAYGPKEAREVQKFTLQHKHDLTGASGSPEHRGMSITRVVFPPANVDASLEMKSELTKKSIDAEVIFQYRTDKKINVVLSGSRSGDEEPKLVRGLAKLTMPNGRTMKMSGEIELNDQLDCAASMSANWMDNVEDATAILKLKRKAGGPLDRELMAQLSLPGQAPLTLTADVEFNDRHKTFHGEVEIEGHKYRTQAEYHRPSLNNVRIAVGAFTPQKSYSGDAELENGKLEKSLKTNLNVDNFRKLSTDIRVKREDHETKITALLKRGSEAYALRLARSTGKGQFVVECPERELGIRWNVTTMRNKDNAIDPSTHVLQGRYEFWWDPNKKLTMDVVANAILTGDKRHVDAHMQMQTPFRNIEQLGMRFAHVDEGHTWKSAAILFVSGETIGAASSEGKLTVVGDSSRRLQASVQVETPFQMMPSFGFDLDHTCSNELRFNSDLAINWYPQKRVQLNVRGSMDGTQLNAAVNLSTPFAAIREARVLGDFMQRDKMTGRVRLVWNEKEIDVGAEGGGRISADKIESYVKIEATTPFRNWKTPSLMLSMAANESGVQTAAEYSWAKDGEKVRVQLEAFHRASDNTAASIHITSPFKFWEDIFVKVTHAKDEMNKFREGVHFRYDRKDVDVQLDWMPPSTRNSYFKLEAREPYGIFGEHVTAVVGHKFASNGWNVDVKATWNNDKSVDLSFGAVLTPTDLTGILKLDLVPLMKSFEKMHVTFSHAWKQIGRRTVIEVSLDGVKKIAATHVMDYENQMNFENELNVQLRFDVIKTFRLKTKQTFSSSRLEHESELRIDDNDLYLIAGSSVAEVEGQPGRVSLRVQLPSWHLVVAGSHDRTNRVAQFDVEYPSDQQKYELAVNYDLRQIALNGLIKMNLSLRTPILSFETMTVTLDYRPESGSLVAQRREDETIKVTWVHRPLSGERIVDSEMNVETPFQGYAKNSFKVTVNDVETSKMAQIYVSFDEDVYQITAAGSCRVDAFNGDYKIHVETPFENSKLYAKYDFRSLDGDQRPADLMVDSQNLGKWEAAVTSNIASSIDFKIELTTPIVDYERIVLSARHGQDIETTTSVNFEKPNFNAEVQLQFNFKPKTGNVLVIVLTPTCVATKSLTLGGRYTPNSISIQASRDDQKFQLDIDVSGSHANRQMVLNVTTPSVDTKFVGEYNVESSPMTAKLSVAEKNEIRAQVDLKLDVGDGRTDFVASFASQIEGMKSITVRGNWKTSARVASALVVVQKEDQTFETQLMASAPKDNRGSFRFTLKTPLDGHALTELILDADLSEENVKSVAMHVRKEEHVLDFEAEARFDSNGGSRLSAVSVAANTSVSGYETLSGAIQFDDRNQKKIYALTLSRGAGHTYQAKWELDVSSPSNHFESSVRVTTPFEDLLVYGQYNLNGGASVDFKVIKGKRMMELSGRFWNDPDWSKMDGNLVFNTNYASMIAVTLGGHYDVASIERKEFLLQYEHNGRRNSFKGKSSLSKEHVLDFSVEGNVPAIIKTFSVSGTVDLASTDEKMAKLTVRLDDNINADVTGSFVRKSDSIEGTFVASTSLSGYESMIVNTKLDTSAAAERTLSVSLKSNGKIHLDVSATQAANQLDVVMQSSISGWESGRVLLDAKNDGRQLTFNAKLNENNILGSVEFVGDRRSGKLDVTLSANFDSFESKRNVEFEYDMVDKRFIARMTSSNNEEDSHSVDLNLPGAGKVVLKLKSPSSGILSFAGQYEDDGKNVVLNGELIRDKDTVFNMLSSFNVMVTSFKVESNVVGEQLRLSFDYDMRPELKRLSAEYAQGSDNYFRLGSSLSVGPTSPLHEIKFSVTSSLVGLKDVEYETSYDAQNSYLTASLQWEHEKQIKFDFRVVPDNSGLAIKLTTPFDGYQLLNLVAEKNSGKDDDSSSKHASMKFEWQDKKMELSVHNRRGASGLSFSSPFAGFDRMSAQLTYNIDQRPSKVAVSLTINERTFEVTTETDLSAQKSRWNVQLTTPNAGQELYVVAGAYDLETGHAEIQMEFDGKKIETYVDLKNEQEGHRLQASVATPFEQFQGFSVDCGGSLKQNRLESDGQIQLRMNGNTHDVLGQFTIEQSNFRAALQLNSDSRTFTLNITGHASPVNVELKLAVNKQDVAFHFLMERLAGATNVNLQLSAVRLDIPSVAVRGKYAGQRDDGCLASLTIHWNDVNVIQGRFEHKRDDITFEFNSQINPLGHAHAHLRLYHEDSHCTFKSTLDMENVGKMTFDVDAAHSKSPSSLDITAKLTTPFRALPEMSSAVTFKVDNAKGRSINIGANLKTPFKYLEWTEMTIHVQNAATSERAIVKLRLSDKVEYVVTKSLDWSTPNTIVGSLVVQTPISNYERIALAGEYGANGKLGLSLKTPTSETSLVVDVDTRPENYEIEVSFGSTFVRFGPVALHAKYAKSAGRIELAAGLTTSQMTHDFRWTHVDVNNAGKLSIVASTSPSFRHAFSADYFLVVPTADRSFYSFFLNNAYSGIDNTTCSSSFKVTLDERFRSFGADLRVKAIDDEHSVVASYIVSSIIKGDVAIKSFLTQRELQLHADVNYEDARATLTIGDVQNLIAATYKPSTYNPSTPKSYDVRLQLDLPSLSMRDAKLEGKVLFGDDQSVDGQITFAHRDYTASGSFHNSKDESRADIELKHPIPSRYWTMSASAKLVGKMDPRKVDTQFAMTTPRKQLMTMKMNWDVEKLHGGIEYFLNDEKVLAGRAQFLMRSDDPNSFEGEISVHYGGVDHSVQVSWKLGRGDEQSSHQSDYEFTLKTPLMGIDTLALRSRLARIYGKQLDGTISMALPNSFHTFSAKLDKDPNKIYFEGMANSPYLKSRSYTLLGKASRESGKNILSFTLANPTETHTLQLESRASIDGTSLFQVKLNTPFLNIGKTTFSFGIEKLTANEMDIVLRVTTSQTSHAATIRATKGMNSIDFHVDFNTPILDVNPVVANVRIHAPNNTQLNFNLSATVAGEVHTVAVHVERTPHGFQGAAQLKTPSIDEVKINGHVNRKDDNDLQLKAFIKTGNDEHAFETRILRDERTFNGNINIESNLIPCKKFAISGNYRRTTPNSMEGDVALETPGKQFKVQTNIRHVNDQVKGTEAGIILTTPFKSLPVFKINGRLDKKSHVDDRSVNGFVEFHTSNADGNNADLGLYLNYRDSTNAALRVRTSVNGYENLEASYHIGRENDGTEILKVTFGNGRFTYGWESEVLRTGEPIRKINLVLIWANDKYVVGGRVNQNMGSLEAELNADFPVQGLRGINYKIQQSNRYRTRTFSSILSGTPFGHSINGEINRKNDGPDLDGHVEVEIPIAGLRALSTKFSQTYQSGQWQFDLEQLSDGEAIIQIQMENTYKDGSGNGKIQVLSPFKSLRNADIYYRFQLDIDGQDAATGSMGVTHNGKPVIEINAKSKDGTRIIEILKLSRPMSIEYTYVRDNFVGKYCWDTEHRHDSSVGFNARLTPWGSSGTGRQLNVDTIHPTRPVNVKFSLERTDDGAFRHDAEFAWGSNNLRTPEAVSYSIVVERNSAMVRLSFPSRNVQVLVTHDSLESCSMLLKWDAGRDETKQIGIRVKHGYLGGGDLQKVERNYEIGLSHPRLEKEIVLRGYVLYDVSELSFIAHTEFEYSQDESQKFVVDAKLLKNSIAIKSGGLLDRTFNWRVRHPASELDVYASGEVFDNVEETSSALRIFYRGNGGQRKVLRVRGQIMKLKNKIEIQMEASGMKLGTSGQISANDNGFSIHLESRINDQEPYTADLQLDAKDKRMAALNVVYNPDKKSTMMMRSGMPNKKTISLEIFRKTDGVTIEDVEFNVNLNNSRELVTRFNWRPDTLQQIEASLPTLVHNLCSKFNDTVKGATKYLVADLDAKFDLFTTSFVRSVLPMTVELSNEMDKIGNDIRTIERSFEKLYEDNVFYIRTVYDIVAPLRIWEHASQLVVGVANAVTGLCRIATNVVMRSAEALCSICDHLCENLLPKLAGHIRDTPYAVLHHANGMFVNFHDMSREAAVHLTLQTIRIFKEVAVYVATVSGQWKDIDTPEWIQNVSKETTAKLQAYMDQFFASEYYLKLKSQLKQLSEAISSVYNHDYLESTWTSYSDKIMNLMEMATKNPYAQIAREMAENLYEIGRWAYEFFDVEGLARDVLQLFMARLEHMTIHTIQEIILPELNLPDTSRDVYFEPRDGKLEIVQRLPLPWKAFDEMPQVLGTPEHQEFERLRENFQHLPTVALKNFKKAWTSEFGGNNQWNVRARALLIGDQHYVTFDGRAFEFAGQCSYLLASDFVGDKFTVIVNYDSNTAIKKSVLIILDGHRIEIASKEARVTIDSVTSELPMSVGPSTHISRSGNTLSIRNDDRHVWFTYDATHDVFALEIGGFYHGKTGGLFGSYDHEPFNDLSTPSSTHQIAENDERFARAWEVGTEKCASHENKARQEKTDSYEVEKPCDGLFGRYNGLDSCLNKVDPSPYRSMCVNDVSIGKGACASAAAYVTMCRFQRIHAALPNDCLHCDVNGAKVIQGEETIVEGSNVERSADVIFIVDNTWQCSTTFPNMRTTLATLARNMEGALHGAQVLHNRYGVVGYGGIDYRPQVLTVGGSSFAPLSQLDRALDNVNFGSGRHHHLSDLIEYGTTELNDFRPTVKKVFVVVPCAEADETIENEMYNRLAERIKDMEAVLHVIAIREPSIPNDETKVADILGYDSTTAFTLKSAQRGVLVGDDKVRQQMVIHETRLTLLAFNSNGSVFFASRLGSVQPTVAGLANEAFARRIAFRAVPSACQNCQCTVAGNGLPTAICTKCSNDAVNDANVEEQNLQQTHKNKHQSATKNVIRQSRKKALNEKTLYRKF